MSEDKLETRISFRTDAGYWKAYWKPHEESMEGAVLLGSISLRLVENEQRRETFRELMKECFADAVEATTGKRPLWVERRFIDSDAE